MDNNWDFGDVNGHHGYVNEGAILPRITPPTNFQLVLLVSSDQKPQPLRVRQTKRRTQHHESHQRRERGHHDGCGDSDDVDSGV